MKSRSRFLNPVLGLLFSGALLAVPGLLAQTTSWQVAGAGDFQTSTNWDFGVPTSAVNAVVNNGTSGTESVVNLTNGGAVDDLTLGAFDTFNVLPGGSLQISGTSISNAGMLNITGGSGSNAFLSLATSTTLSGTGVLNLSFNGIGNGAGFIEQSTGGVTLTNQSTIAGAGTIGNGGIVVDNDTAGVINANVSGQTLLIDGGGLTNHGLLEATSGGTLYLQGQDVANSSANITAATGSTVKLDSMTIVGGTLNINGTGVIENLNNTVLDGSTSGALTINGTFTAGPGTNTNFSGSIINNGNIQINGGNGSNAFLGLNADTTFQGTGATITLGYTGTGTGAAFIEQATGGVTLTNKETIQGQGTIGNGGLTFVNATGATVNANVSGQSIEFDNSGGVTNHGLLEATGGATLLIDGITVANTGANITAGTGSTVQFNNATITGGTLNANGTGVLQNLNSTTLDGSSSGAFTINGNFLATAGGTTTTVSGSIINNGNIQINGGGGSNSFLVLNADTTFQGTGATITLGYTGTGSGAAFIEQGTGGVTLTNKETIQGQGTIGNGGLTFVNATGAIVNANVSGQSIEFDNSGGVTNHGLLEATSGATLLIDGITVANTGSNITAGTASTVQFSDATIIGGTLNANGTGVLQNLGSTTLDGNSSGALTINGNFLATAGGTTTTVAGSIINNGNIQIDGGGGSNSFLVLNADTTFQGTGATITLGYTGTGSGAAFIQQGTGMITLTNKETIQGQGTIGNGGIAVLNSTGGTIDANVNGATLTLDGSGGVANTGGLLEATNGGLLSLSGSTIDNAGGTIKVDGATSAIQFVDGVTIQGGTIASSNGGSLGVPGTSITLDGSTLGALTLSTGTIFTAGSATETNLLGTIVNNGNMQFNGGNGSNTFVGLEADTTLKGTGTITLGYTGTGTGQAIIQQLTGGITLTNMQTIQGQGMIGNGGLAVLNDANGTIDANVNGATLTVNGSGGFANTGGLLEATNGGLLSLSGSTIDNAGGTIKVDGAASAIQLVDGVTIQGGTLTSSNGGSFGVPGSSITLDGSTQGALTLSTGTSFTAGSATETNLLGTIVNNGNMQFNGGNGSNTFIGLTADTTLKGTGTITLGYTGTGTGQAIIQQTTGGITLTNEQTIQGQGMIGNGGLAVLNDANGTITANVSGETLTLNGTGTLTNAGLLEAINGGDLEIDHSMVANTGGLIDVHDGSSIHLTNPTTVTGGKLGGTGTIEGDLINDATVFMGTDETHPGVLSEVGNFTQDSGGTLFESISGSSNGTLDVTGNLDLGGVVDVDLLAGFTPTNGEEFDLVNYSGNLTGAFSGIIGSDASEWQIVDLPDSVDLRFGSGVVTHGVPEPGAWADLAFIVVMLLGSRLIRWRTQPR